VSLTNQQKHWKTIYEAYQLSQLITEGTRITNRSCTLIDHYVTSMPEKINLSGVTHTGISDHSLIYGIRKINPIISSRKNGLKKLKYEIWNGLINIILMRTFLLSSGNKLSYNQMQTLCGLFGNNYFLRSWTSMLQFSMLERNRLVSRGWPVKEKSYFLIEIRKNVERW
jgi:hypothetical protein